MISHYQTLRITPAATETEIKKAYRKLALEYTYLPVPEYSTDYNHRELSEAEKKEFEQIQIAYEVLSNPITKTEYDKEMTLTTANQHNSATLAITDKPHEYNIRKS